MRLVLSHYGGSMKAEFTSLDTMSWLARIPDVSKGNHRMVVLLKADIASQGYITTLININPSPNAHDH